MYDYLIIFIYICFVELTEARTFKGRAKVAIRQISKLWKKLKTECNLMLRNKCA